MGIYKEQISYEGYIGNPKQRFSRANFSTCKSKLHLKEKYGI